MLPVWAVWVPRSSLNFACRPENKKRAHQLQEKISGLADRYSLFTFFHLSILQSWRPDQAAPEERKNRAPTDRHRRWPDQTPPEEPRKNRAPPEESAARVVSPGDRPYPATCSGRALLQKNTFCRLFASYFPEVSSPGSSVQETNFHGVGHS